jgi:hypothetical protein
MCPERPPPGTLRLQVPVLAPAQNRSRNATSAAVCRFAMFAGKSPRTLCLPWKEPSHDRHCPRKRWARQSGRAMGMRIAGFLGAILAIVECLLGTLHQSRSRGGKARQRPAARSGLSRPLMAKLETIGHPALVLAPKSGLLPPPWVTCCLALADHRLSQARSRCLLSPRSCAKPRKPSRRTWCDRVGAEHHCLHVKSRCSLVPIVESFVGNGRRTLRSIRA